MLRPFLAALALGAFVPAALAQQAETYNLPGAQVTVTLHDFLTEEENSTLQIIGQSPDALELFLPEGGRFAALAVAPDEGFIRDGIPVESAVAIGNLPDLAEARAAALEGCNAARSGGAECQIVLEISPD